MSSNKCTKKDESEKRETTKILEKSLDKLHWLNRKSFDINSYLNMCDKIRSKCNGEAASRAYSLYVHLDKEQCKIQDKIDEEIDRIAAIALGNQNDKQ